MKEIKHYRNISTGKVIGLTNRNPGPEYALMTDIEFEDLKNKPPTKEQVKMQAANDRLAKMLEGADYNGDMISLTSEDGNGMLQVKAAFEMGLTETVIHFENGTKLPVNSDNFPDFAAWFVIERNRFF